MPKKHFYDNGKNNHELNLCKLSPTWIYLSLPQWINSPCFNVLRRNYDMQVMIKCRPLIVVDNTEQNYSLLIGPEQYN